MSDMGSTRDNDDFDGVIVPPSATLVTSPNSPFGDNRPPLKEESDDEGQEEEAREPSPSPLPAYDMHPHYRYEDGNLFVVVENYLFRLHNYHFAQDEASVINQLSNESGSSERNPVVLPGEIKIAAFESILAILYKSPLDRRPIPIKTLRDACLATHALNMSKLCHELASYIMETDCADEPLDEAVPKYVLCTKLPRLFTPAFKNAQIDKLCCAHGFMTHSHFFELGFHELNKVMKGAFAARIGYDGNKVETYQPAPPPPRNSYLIKPKNEGAYRASKREVFGIGK